MKTALAGRIPERMLCNKAGFLSPCEIPELKIPSLRWETDIDAMPEGRRVLFALKPPSINSSYVGYRKGEYVHTDEFSSDVPLSDIVVWMFLPEYTPMNDSEIRVARIIRWSTYRPALLQALNRVSIKFEELDGVSPYDIMSELELAIAQELGEE